MQSIKYRKMNDEKNKIKKELYERLEILNSEKAKNLISMGIFLHEKIRSNKTIYRELEIECENIKNIDKEIYTINTKLNELITNNIQECDCGAVIKIDNKFCPECGKKVYIENESKVLCSRCNTQVNKEFKFCICCGNKTDL